MTHTSCRRAKTPSDKTELVPSAPLSLLASLAAVSFAHAAVAAESDTTTVRLNGLEITLDSHTGAIRRLEYAGPGTLLEAEAIGGRPGRRGLSDRAVRAVAAGGPAFSRAP